MKAVILDASEGKESLEEGIVKTIQNELEKQGHSVELFRPGEMDILPCRSCGACGFKSPGVCVQKDDMPKIIRAVANSSLLVLVTPLRYGSYPSHLKKALDRFMILGLPLYMMKGGHMLHPMRYKAPSILAVGTAKDQAEAADNALDLTVAHNAMNLGSPGYKTLVYERSSPLQTIENGIKRALSEVKGQ